MADLRHLLAIYVHAHQTGNSVPPHIDAEARAALAAEPPAPAEPDTDAVLALAAIIRRVDGSHSLGAAALAEAILSHPDAANVFQPPAPTPAADGAARLRQCPTHGQQPANAWACPECLRELREELARFKAPAADGEREELAQWLDHKGRGAWPCPDGFSAEAEAEEYEMFSGLTRAAALLREPAPAPVPVPVAERLLQAEDCRFNVGASVGSCWCWNPPAYAGSSGWWSFEPLEFAEDATHWLPHWAIPQPPQGGEVEA